ncbi:type II toxin-antitoxin system RelE/ParE family toxin [Rhodopseudomonas sp. HC1]|uniref:type II toxin-antitoxin system RelE/ParE family toxin n=1 Tax=Rhodopseudomonas infernalis TaxID=2897386 RepID=UPI001EE7F8C3|nr:type II toxin-antitoxin system RelE/ParE family toxin [Rhodopseudomonas infernalis]MCG6205867.1 type II toxin-antitoxin system RelE/ParE family toxin [Rhodopseudomonas infernalis]
MANRARKSPQAERDIAAIWSYVAKDNVNAADRLLEAIEKVFDVLAHSPLLGRARPELSPKLRSFPSGSYVLYYLPLKDGVVVVRVMHGRQDISPEDFR